MAAHGHWHGKLQLSYRRDGARTVAHDRHDGPLRVLQRLYPEGDKVCHHVLVHPPGGLVGGDTLEVEIDLAEQTHALITTPGATRFYRSLGPPARQQVSARVAEGARLEWLPLETIAFDGCVAENRLSFDLANGAEMMGWDVLALGLPASGQPWSRGHYHQHLELPGHWLDRAHLDAADRALLDSPLGWAGHRVLATLWFAAGQDLTPARRESLRQAANDAIHSAMRTRLGEPAATCAGVTAPFEQGVVLRVLAPRVEPAMALLIDTWQRWRCTAWERDAPINRVWRT